MKPLGIHETSKNYVDNWVCWNKNLLLRMGLARRVLLLLTSRHCEKLLRSTTEQFLMHTYRIGRYLTVLSLESAVNDSNQEDCSGRKVHRTNIKSFSHLGIFSIRWRNIPKGVQRPFIEAGHRCCFPFSIP